MKKTHKTIEQMTQKLSKQQILENLKLRNLKGGADGCPPPWPDEGN